MSYIKYLVCGDTYNYDYDNDTDQCSYAESVIENDAIAVLA